LAAPSQVRRGVNETRPPTEKKKKRRLKPVNSRRVSPRGGGENRLPVGEGLSRLKRPKKGGSKKRSDLSQKEGEGKEWTVNSFIATISQQKGIGGFAGIVVPGGGEAQSGFRRGGD